MRLLSLDVSCIRGIKNISLKPSGGNVVVYGPNGTGKSAIVDSVDFLLTGKISRLAGEGTGVLSLKEHGCHIDSRNNLEDTVVKAKIKFGNDEAILQRSLSKPTELIVEPKSLEEKVHSLLELAELGQHLLTRRDILQYITAEAGRRAKKVMSLLDLDRINSIRQMLVSINTETQKESDVVRGNLATAQLDLATLMSIESFSEDELLIRINQIRSILNGSPITKLTVEEIKKDLTARPFDTALSTISNSEVQNAIVMVRIFFDRKAEGVYSNEKQLTTLLEEVEKNKTLCKCVMYESLIKAGISLVDESNECPLCGRLWTDGKFIDYLIEKEKEANIGKEKHKQISEISQTLKLWILQLENLLTKYKRAQAQFKIKSFPTQELDSVLTELDEIEQNLANPLNSYEKGQWSKVDLHKTLTSINIEEMSSLLSAHLEQNKQTASPEQIAWDKLTQCQERFRVYRQTLNQKLNCDLFKKRSSFALDSFEEVMNSELEKLYDSVQKDFDKNYRTIHGQDEENFSSKIAPSGAELNFEVDFYQRGRFPPHALHSEGHQDSMGIALFFALNLYLIKSEIEIIVLDDVIQSIDSGHRRGICGLLKSLESSRQLIITTHDSAWAQQLKSQSIVKKNNLIHFTNWNVDSGPAFELEKDLWDLLNEDLNKDQIPIAAARLRRNLECFFCDVCDSFGAPIRYHGYHQWDLGEYASAAKGAYLKSLIKAKNNARKIENTEKYNELNALETKSRDIFERTQIDQWIVNENVHYNKWDVFSKQDFLPLISAYKDLFALFYCPKCGEHIQFKEVRGDNPSTNISCKCGASFWDTTN